jgi:UDP-2,3-diacylglucosamine hydrolase
MDKSNTSLQKMAKKKVFFASDFHLGVPTYEASLKREKLLVKWLMR